MGINSTSWLTSILQGKKGLSAESSRKLAEVLKLNKHQIRFFCLMVKFNQSRSREESDRCYQQLIELSRIKDVYRVQDSQYQFYSTWYHSIIRSLIGLTKIKPSEKTYAKIGKLISPPISEDKVKKSLKLLEELNLIYLDAEGFYRLQDSVISTGDQVRSLAVANFQLKAMDLGKYALDNISSDHRNISTLTLGISSDAFKTIEDEIVDFRKRIIEIAKLDQDSDNVYQLNMQFFPVVQNCNKQGKLS